MRVLLRGLLLLSVALAGPAYAADEIVDASAVQFGAERGQGTGAGLLNIAVTDFGRPSPDNPNSVPLKVGYGVNMSLAEAYTNLGPCELSAQLGQVGLEASAGMGSARTQRGRNADRSVSALPDCNLSAEANLVALNAECETAVGTFAASAKGPGGKAACTCSGCEAGVHYAWFSGSYTTPSVGGCGLQVSATVSAEGGIGAHAAVGMEGDVGAKATVGPVGLGAGINIDEFDPGAMGDCLVNAAQAVGGAIADGAQAVWNGAGDLLSGAADLAGNAWDGATGIAGDIAGGLSDLGGGIVDGIGGLFGGGDDGGGLFGGLFGGGNNSDRNAPTTPTASNPIPNGSNTHHGAGTPR